MSNWRALTFNDLLAIRRSELLGTAQSKSLTVGSTTGNDPVAESIAGATSKVRAVISTGNQLDQAPANIPNSLIQLAARIAWRALAPRIPMPLSKDDDEERIEDDDYMKMIVRHQITFETPDNPAGPAEMQQEDSVAVQGGHCDVNGYNWRGYSAAGLRGLL